jgi:hypothetical protein
MAAVQELYAVNRVFVQDPRRPVPQAHAVRDDIFGPHVVKGLASGAGVAWSAYEEGGLVCATVEVPRAFQTVPMTRVGCYVICRIGPGLFTNARAVGARDGAGMRAWLEAYCDTMFVTTGAWYAQEGAAGGEAGPVYTMAKNGAQLWTAPPSPQALVERGYFSLCGGLTVALAMEQAGLWDADVLAEAVEAYRCNVMTGEARDPYVWYISNILPIWIPFVIQPRYDYDLHIADTPFLYAAQCGSAGAVLRFLQSNIFGSNHSFVQTKEHVRPPLFANMTSAAFPRRLAGAEWPTSPFPHTATPTADWMGYLQMLLTDGAAWATWRASASVRRRVLDAARGRRYELFIPLFHLYEHGIEGWPTIPRYRLRALMDDVRDYDRGMLSGVVWIRHYLVRLLLKEEARRYNPAIGAKIHHNAPPPLAFLTGIRDEFGPAFGTWLFEQKEVMIRHPHVHPDVDPAMWVVHLRAAGWEAHAVGVEAGASGGLQLRLRFSLWQVLVSLADTYPTIAAFVEQLRHGAADKLDAVLKAAGAPAACQSLVGYLMGVREVLY